MRYDPQKTSERLHGVPIKDRVFIYNAAIIIEFLNETLMPLSFFLKPGIELPARDLERTDLKNPKDMDDQKISIGDLYEFYKLFRQQKGYTAAIESRYKFSAILKKLTYKKNGWKFRVRRVGRAQLIYMAPAQLRVRVPLEIRKLFPAPVVNLSAAQVDDSPGDDDIKDEDSPTGSAGGPITPENFVGPKPADPHSPIDGSRGGSGVDERVEPDTNDPSQFPAEGSDIGY